MAKTKKQLNRIMQKKIRESVRILPPCMYIISEGTKTEPNYIKGFADSINRKYRDYSSGEIITVEGTGRNTRNLLEYARKQVETTNPQAKIVWLVYDKDDFPESDFDNTFYSAQKSTKNNKREYRPVWSNESFELWLLLHFQEVKSDIGRLHCIKLLKKYLGSYEKNNPDIYDKIKDKTDIAIKRAKKLVGEYNDKEPPSKMCPCTMVYKLAEELKNYL